jgi:hypothetical protein
MAFVLSRGNEQARCEFRFLQPLKPCAEALRVQAICDAHSVVFCEAMTTAGIFTRFIKDARRDVIVGGRT